MTYFVFVFRLRESALSGGESVFVHAKKESLREQ